GWSLQIRQSEFAFQGASKMAAFLSTSIGIGVPNIIICTTQSGSAYGMPDGLPNRVFLTSEQAGTHAAWVARGRAALSLHRLPLHPMRPSNLASLFAPWDFCPQPTAPGSAASAGNEYCCAAR